MKSTRLLFAALLIAAAFSLPAQESAVSALFQTDVADASNQESLVLEVTYPPGAESASHRHNAHTFVYVLEGAVEMQVAGGEIRRLEVGDTFYESPSDIHTVSRNASDTEAARILVYFIKMKDAPASEPADD